MAPLDERVGRLRLPREDQQLQACAWNIERFGWLLLAALLPLVVFGLFRQGPLSRGEASGASGDLRLQYERLPHEGTLTSLRIRAQSGGEGRVWVTLSGPLAERFALERIRPRPASIDTRPDGLRLRFETAPYGRLQAELLLRPYGAGLARSTVRSGNEQAGLTQWVLP